MTTSTARLSDRDVVRWTEIQATLLRRAAETGTNLPLAVDPRRGWQETFDRERSEIAAVLADSPSLQRETAAALERRWPVARRRAVRALSGEVEEALIPCDCPFAVEQALDPDWWPERVRP